MDLGFETSRNKMTKHDIDKGTIIRTIIMISLTLLLLSLFSWTEMFNVQQKCLAREGCLQFGREKNGLIKSTG